MTMGVSMPVDATSKVDLKPFEVLESRIQRTIELVGRLKEENSTLKSQLSSFQGAAAEAAARSKELDAVRLSSQQLEREMKELQEERRAVAARVGDLLENLERLPLD